MGMCFCASHSSHPDKPMHTMAMSQPQSLKAACSVSLKPSGQPISNRPANISRSQGVVPTRTPQSNVEQQAGGIFERLFHRHQAQHGFAPVDDAVVVAHGQVVHGADDDLPVFDHGALFGGVHAQNG